jgi:hypothetical protein
MQARRQALLGWAALNALWLPVGGGQGAPRARSTSPVSSGFSGSIVSSLPDGPPVTGAATPPAHHLGSAPVINLAPFCSIDLPPAPGLSYTLPGSDADGGGFEVWARLMNVPPCTEGLLEVAIDVNAVTFGPWPLPANIEQIRTPAGEIPFRATIAIAQEGAYQLAISVRRRAAPAAPAAPTALAVARTSFMVRRLVAPHAWDAFLPRATLGAYKAAKQREYRARGRAAALAGAPEGFSSSLSSSLSSPAPSDHSDPSDPSCARLPLLALADARDDSACFTHHTRRPAAPRRAGAAPRRGWGAGLGWHGMGDGSPLPLGADAVRSPWEPAPAPRVGDAPGV